MVKNDWFVSEEIVDLDLGDGNIIKYKDEISYDEYMECVDSVEISAAGITPNEAIKMAIPLMEKAIVGWNLKDGEGKAIPFKKELIPKMKAELLMKIGGTIMSHYQPEKKSAQS
jgi:hypothetical protein